MFATKARKCEKRLVSFDSCFVFSCPACLEVELLDVAPVEQHRRSEDDLAAANIDVPEPSGLELPGAGLQLVLRCERAGIDREVSKVARVPENDGLHDPVADVGLVDVGQ